MLTYLCYTKSGSSDQNMGPVYVEPPAKLPVPFAGECSNAGTRPAESTPTAGFLRFQLSTLPTKTFTTLNFQIPSIHPFFFVAQLSAPRRWGQQASFPQSGHVLRHSESHLTIFLVLINQKGIYWVEFAQWATKIEDVWGTYSKNSCLFHQLLGWIVREEEYFPFEMGPFLGDMLVFGGVRKLSTIFCFSYAFFSCVSIYIFCLYLFWVAGWTKTAI